MLQIVRVHRRRYSVIDACNYSLLETDDIEAAVSLAVAESGDIYDNWAFGDDDDPSYFSTEKMTKVALDLGLTPPVDPFCERS